MKNILLTLIFLINIGCKDKPKKIAFENLKAENEISTSENIELDENNKSLIIPFKEYQIEFVAEKNDLEILEKFRIKKDTLFLFGPDITELKSIKLKGLKSNEFRISQMYKSKLILQFDGKAFEMKNWKEYKSEWFQNSNENNVRKYSEKDYAKFPNYNRKDLLNALKINKKTISEHWYNFVIENIDKKESEVFFEPIINKTIFKIEIIGNVDIYVELKHMKDNRWSN
jgi:hypothetical protein